MVPQLVQGQLRIWGMIRGANRIFTILGGLSNLLSENGIGKDWEPNEFEYFIESIIDTLSRSFYEKNK
ncbi:hypothetical protein DYBT9623_02917 [Dyadobacter sp. CECT 9623]|uniref:Uncharacterized protein n=1 Tax=Dyadobacter linearis TaxID=2823330 RepID=A0ABM8URT1_9BACT|nr:hypothetical protein DYBT9623_02917 [Dyadobacter sp. CECT 9623]